MTHFTVSFPEKYDSQNIYLKDILEENAGIKFCIALMRKIFDTQVIKLEEARIIVISQVYIPYKEDCIYIF